MYLCTNGPINNHINKETKVTFEHTKRIPRCNKAIRLNASFDVLQKV